MFRRAAIVLTLLTTPAVADQPKFSDYPAEIYAGKVAKSSKVDGFHLDPEAHAAIGAAIAAKAAEIA